MLLVLAAISLVMLFFQPAAEPTDIGPIIGLILARALQLTSVVKIIVDGVARYMIGMENYLFLIALGLGVGMDFAVLAIGATPFTRQSVVMAIVAGVLAGIGSKVITDVHKAVRPDTVNLKPDPLVSDLN